MGRGPVRFAQGRLVGNSSPPARGRTDTTFTVRLPTLQPGEQTRVWVDLFCWESDGDTAKVKFAAPEGRGSRDAPRAFVEEVRRTCF